MRRLESRPLTARSVAWDAWRAKRGGPAAIAARQEARLQALVEHARRASRFYAEHYRAVPTGPIRLEELDRLPAVTKPELMARFDDWVTDRAVNRAGVEEFVASLDNLGRDFLGRYVVFTTSGSTGVPALLVQDQRAVAVMTGLAYVRGLSALNPKLAAKMLTRPPRVAAVFAQGGHFLSTTMFERAADGTISAPHLAVLLGARSIAGAGRPAQCLPPRHARHLRQCTGGAHRGAGSRPVAPFAAGHHQWRRVTDTGNAASRGDRLPLPGYPGLCGLGSHAAGVALPPGPAAPQQ